MEGGLERASGPAGSSETRGARYVAERGASRTPISSHLFIKGVRQPIACRTYRSSDELNMSPDTTSLLKFSTLAAFTQVKNTCDVIVNNAVCVTSCSASLRTMFEVTVYFWGATSISRVAAPFFCEVNVRSVGGWLVQISLIGGFVGLPGCPA
ncbi:hypothetical protein VTO73DRAFT_15301 [Trametes versicolor]